jgi:hypothetical protein
MSAVITFYRKATIEVTANMWANKSYLFVTAPNERLVEKLSYCLRFFFSAVPNIVYAHLLQSTDAH